MADYQNYDEVNWTLATPITAGRLQQITTNIFDVKSATGGYAKGILVVNEFTAQMSTETNTVLHTGLTDATYVVSVLNSTSGSGSSDQRIVLEASRYYKVCLEIPDIILQSGHAGSHFTLSLIKTVSSTDTTLASFNIMSTNPTLSSRYFGGGVYSIIIDTAGGDTTPHEFKATIVQSNRVAEDTGTYQISASATAPIQLWVEDAGASS
jgi:hypothetical protein